MYQQFPSDLVFTPDCNRAFLLVLGLAVSSSDDVHHFDRLIFLHVATKNGSLATVK